MILPYCTLWAILFACLLGDAVFGDPYAFGPKVVRYVEKNDFQRGENRTLCKAVWFFAEWNSTFGAIMKRIMNLNETVHATKAHHVSSAVYNDMSSLSASIHGKIKDALRGVSVALTANQVFRASVLRDFYTAFESVQGIVANFTFGHANVMKGNRRATEAEATFDYLMSDFSYCENNFNSPDVPLDEEESAEESYFTSEEEEDSISTEKREDCAEKYNGNNDLKLYFPDNKNSYTHQSLMELKVNKSILWEQVGRDTQCAVKGMNVSTHISKKNSKLAFTENMWRQGLINLTDIIGRNCTRAESSEGGALPQLEACYRLRPTICGMSEASGKNAVGNEFSVIDNSTFRGNMLGYGCENISETCHNFPDCSRADAKRDDKWASISAALGKLKCPVANTAIGWLGLRFATALDFMKAQFTSVLNNLSEAESQLRGVILKEAAMAKEDICKKRESLEAGRSSIDSFKKQIASSKLQLSKFKNVSSQLTSEANDLTVRSSMATEVIEQVEKVVLSKKLAGNVLDTNGNAQIAAKNSFQAARDAALLVQKTSDAIQSLLRVCERAEEKVNERTISLTESIRTISSALDQAFSGGHGKNFSECESAFSLSSPPTPISGIDALLSALNGVVVSRDLGDVDATLAECKNEHSKLSDILGKASAGVDASVKGITEASKSASAAVDAAREVLLEAFKERERALCETVEHLVNVKMSALKLRERMERMKARAVSHVTRFLNAEVATKTVGRGKSDPIYSAQISDKRRRIEVISSEMENVASAILTEAGAVTKKSETQIGEIASTFDKAAREMTGKSVVLDEHVCKAGNEYTITAQLRPALASILTLMSLNNPTDLQAALGKMQRDFETLRQLRNEAKKIADEADVAALRAQQGDNVPACVPLFEQLLRALK